MNPAQQYIESHPEFKVLKGRVVMADGTPVAEMTGAQYETSAFRNRVLAFREAVADKDNSPEWFELWQPTYGNPTGEIDLVKQPVYGDYGDTETN